VRQAQQDTDLEQQKVALKQFMDQSGSFLQKHPDQMLLWKLRAASSISMNDPIAGYEAGQKLLAAGAADSNDANLQQLLAGIKNKGWLDKQGAEDAQEYIWLRSLNLSLTYGDWLVGRLSVHKKTTMTLTVSGLDDMKEPVSIRLENGSPKTCRLDGGATEHLRSSREMPPTGHTQLLGQRPFSLPAGLAMNWPARSKCQSSTKPEKRLVLPISIMVTNKLWKNS